MTFIAILYIALGLFLLYNDTHNEVSFIYKRFLKKYGFPELDIFIYMFFWPVIFVLTLLHIILWCITFFACWFISLLMLRILALITCNDDIFDEDYNYIGPKVVIFNLDLED
jgi:hypothetical protein